jgi:hypothetical protein
MLCLLLPIVGKANEIEHDISGIVDVRLSYGDTIQSYVDGGLGKFRFSPNETLSLGQLGGSLNSQWSENWSSHIVVNAYADGLENNIGFTEARLQYRDIPNEHGIRLSAAFGLIYPQISMENIATAWSSPYTLSYSTMNSWIGEEVRHLGASFTVETLGKYRQSKHDFSLTSELISSNDTTGAMLAWHGWTQSSRQSLHQQRLPITAIPAMDEGGKLAAQAPESNPFIELDNQVGGHVVAKWTWLEQGQAQVGYYDNNANTLIVKKGQYVWHTRFSHIGTKWRLPYNIDFISQFMTGSTLMTSTLGEPVVDNDFASFYSLFSKKWQRHRLTARFEDFSVTDKDSTPYDDNNEQGHSITLGYQYQIERPWFLHLEYNYLDTTRSARVYLGESVDLQEQQVQLATRYFF